MTMSRKVSTLEATKRYKRDERVFIGFIARHSTASSKLTLFIMVIAMAMVRDKEFLVVRYRAREARHENGVDEGSVASDREKRRHES